MPFVVFCKFFCLTSARKVALSAGRFECVFLFHQKSGCLGGGPSESCSECPGVEVVPLFTEQPHFHRCHQWRRLRVEGPLPRPAGGQGSHRPRLHNVYDPAGWTHSDRRKRAAVSRSSSGNFFFSVVLGETDRSIYYLEKMQTFSLLSLLHQGDQSAISPRGP